GRLEAATTLRGVISETLQPRLAEMFLAVRERLSRAGFHGDNAPQRVVLVGGGAQIPGIRDLAAQTLGLPVRVGRPNQLSGFDHGDAGPGFAASAGLLRYRLDTPQLEDVEESFAPSLNALASVMRSSAGKAWDWLRENF